MSEGSKSKYGSMERARCLHELDLCRFVIDSLPTAVFTVDSELRITDFNPCAEKTSGYTTEEVLGRHCKYIFRGSMCADRCPMKTVLSGHKALHLVEGTIQNKWGKIIPVRINSAGLFDDDGNLIGGVESFDDISIVKAYERERDNLISMFAHDMKSSVTIMGGFALRLLREIGKLDGAKQKEYLGIIKSESSKLEMMINDFLAYSRLQTGQLKLNISATSLYEELAQVFDSYKVKASQSRITLRIENDESLPIINGDAMHLRRVFANLLDNAIKFSDEESTVKVSTHETPKEVIIKIKDEGVGIASEELPYIFEPFHRGQDSEEKRGFGLGLAGVKTILEAHGGRIQVCSEKGEGSVFSVVLPKKREDDNGRDADDHS